MIFNKINLLERFDNDFILINEVIKIFLKDTPIQIEQLKEYVKVNDVKNIKLLAHSIKGASSNVSCDEMRIVAEHIEHQTQEDLLILCYELQIRFFQVKVDLEEFIHKDHVQ